MKHNTKHTGDVAEVAILFRCIEKGFTVSVPYGENQGYDLVVDDGDTLHRVQVKHAFYKNGALIFSAVSNHNHRGGGPTNYTGKADVFGVYSSQLKTCYWVPIPGLPVGGKVHLRVDAPKNGMQKRIRWANDYVL